MKIYQGNIFKLEKQTAKTVVKDDLFLFKKTLGCRY